jgi:2'-5' RNA ligase
MRPNWFVALPVPPTAWFAARITAPPAGCRLLHADDLHFTVAFLGAVEEHAARAGFAALRWPGGAQEVTLGDVVPMGNPRRFSALSAVAVAGRAELEAAMTQARSAVWAAAGASPDSRPARAHLTLARPQRRATAAQRTAALAWAAGLRLHAVRIALDRIALYTWAADRKERRFRIVHACGLG